MTEHDLPQPKVKVRKEGRVWFWIHPGCSLYVADTPEGMKSFPRFSYDEAREAALVHVQVHGRF